MEDLSKQAQGVTILMQVQSHFVISDKHVVRGSYENDKSSCHEQVPSVR